MSAINRFRNTTVPPAAGASAIHRFLGVGSSEGLGQNPIPNTPLPDFSTPPPPSYGTDPGVQQALAQQQLGVAQNDSDLQAAQQRAIIDFGDPALAGMAGFGLDPQAASFARQNYLSGNAQLARLDKSHGLARQAIINRLAAHGILNSGDLGYLEGQENQNYGNQVYDSRQKLLTYLSQLYSQSQARKKSLNDALLQAYQNLYSQVPS